MPRQYPRLRAFSNCPLCGFAKPLSALCCWECFNKHSVAVTADCNGNHWAEGRFARAEANLATASAVRSVV